jgi:hypothetical protein
MAMPSFELVSRPEQPMSPSGGQITKFDDPYRSLTFFGYVGFRYMSDFRKFATDIEFVSAYIHYRRMMKFVKGGPKSHLKALAWLYLYTQPDGSRIATDANPDKHPIPSSFDAVWERYGHDKSKKSELIGCLLYLVDETFQHAALNYEAGASNTPPAATIASTYADLRNNHRFKIPTRYKTTATAAALRKDHPLPPGLRSESTQRYQEYVCERWNRIWQCFRMMDYFRTSFKKSVLFSVDQDKMIFSMDPKWWRTNDTQPKKDTRPQRVILQEAISQYYGKAVKCEEEEEGEEEQENYEDRERTYQGEEQSSNEGPLSDTSGEEEDEEDDIDLGSDYDEEFWLKNEDEDHMYDESEGEDEQDDYSNSDSEAEDDE